MPEILNKKQLEDAAECGTDKPCSKCNCRDIRKRNPVCKCVSEVAQTALAYREMLEWLEWIDNDCCPICWEYEANGHANDCELGALLKESEGEEG